MSPVDLETRTTDFALRIVKLLSALPKTTEAQVLGKQLLRSGTSVEHYREAKRADRQSISSAGLKVRYKNLTRLVTGLS